MDLSDKEDLIWLSELVRDVRDASPPFNPLLVGAMARDLLLHYAHAVPIIRATADVDLAFAVVVWANLLVPLRILNKPEQPGTRFVWAAAIIARVANR